MLRLRQRSWDTLINIPEIQGDSDISAGFPCGDRQYPNMIICNRDTNKIGRGKV